MMKFILIILICMCLTGCAAISEYYHSQPMDIGTDYKFWPANEIVAFNLEDIKLYLQPQNSFVAANGGMLLLPIPFMEPRKEIEEDYSKGTYLFKEDASYIEDIVEGDYFYIEILMRVKKDGFSFNPKEVYLELENKEYIRASKYIVPNMELWGPSKSDRSYLLRPAKYSWRKESNEQAVSKYFKIPPKEYVGFAIRFDYPTPNPGTPFNIEIKGLKRFESIVPIPEIRYKDKKIYRDCRTS